MCRVGKYASKGDLIAIASGNMPSWAMDDPALYWRAADTYERANGRLCVVMDYALPCEMGEDVAVEIAIYMASLYGCPDGVQRLPYTVAVHCQPNSRNIHAHLIISERITDDVERTPQEHFSKAAPTPKPGKPEPKSKRKGGARKSTLMMPPEWLRWARLSLAQVINYQYDLAGLPHRIDHRSYEEQGVDKIPQEHMGPRLAAIARREGMYADGVAAAKQLRNAIRTMTADHGILPADMLAAIQGSQQQFSTSQLVAAQKAETRDIGRHTKTQHVAEPEQDEPVMRR